MFIIAKTLKGREYLYSTKQSILCTNEQQARILAEHLNNNNDTTSELFKLKDGEVWFLYNIDQYDTPPAYKLVRTKGKISVRCL